MKEDELSTKTDPTVQEVATTRIGQQPVLTTDKQWSEQHQFPLLTPGQSNLQAVSMHFDTPHLKNHRIIDNVVVALLPLQVQLKFSKLFGIRFPELVGERKGAIFFSGHMHADNIFYNRICTLHTISHFPDILITTDVNSLLFRSSKLLNDRNFSTFNYVPNKIFAGTAIAHPYKLFRVIAADALVMVAVRDKFTQRQQPREWYELLNPAFENSLVFCGDVDYQDMTMYLHFVRDFGLDAVKQLARNTKARMHPLEMLDAIARQSIMDASVYVMPYSYAIKISNQADFAIIWPSDGAIALPVQLLVKKDALEPYRDIVRFLTGSELGWAFHDEGLISTNPKIEHHFAGNTLKWIGWDFLRNTDYTGLKNDLHRILS